jgi:hypothetical protein
MPRHPPSNVPPPGSILSRCLTWAAEPPLPRGGVTVKAEQSLLMAAAISYRVTSRRHASATWDIPWGMPRHVDQMSHGLLSPWLGADRRAPSAERRAPSAELRVPSTERRAPRAGRRAPSSERRAASAEQRAPRAGRRAPGAGRKATAGHSRPMPRHPPSNVPPPGSILSRCLTWAAEPPLPRGGATGQARQSLLVAAAISYRVTSRRHASATWDIPWGMPRHVDQMSRGLLSPWLGADRPGERRAPSSERRAERRAPSAEQRAPTRERRAPSAECRAPSSDRRAPSSGSATSCALSRGSPRRSSTAAIRHRTQSSAGRRRLREPLSPFVTLRGEPSGRRPARGPGDLPGAGSRQRACRPDVPRAALAVAGRRPPRRAPRAEQRAAARQRRSAYRCAGRASWGPQPALSRPATAADRRSRSRRRGRGRRRPCHRS